MLRAQRHSPKLWQGATHTAALQTQLLHMGSKPAERVFRGIFRLPTSSSAHLSGPVSQKKVAYYA